MTDKTQLALAWQDITSAMSHLRISGANEYKSNSLFSIRGDIENMICETGLKDFDEELHKALKGHHMVRVSPENLCFMCLAKIVKKRTDRTFTTRQELIQYMIDHHIQVE